MHLASNLTHDTKNIERAELPGEIEICPCIYMLEDKSGLLKNLFPVVLGWPNLRPSGLLPHLL